MPCLLVFITLLAPRLAIVLLWLLTGWFHGVFSGILWPILGFFLLPTTLLWYSAVRHWFGGHWSLVTPVRRTDLTPEEQRFADASKDIRIP